MIAQTETAPPVADLSPPQAQSLTYKDAEADCRHKSSDALLQWKDAVVADLADDDADYPGPVGRELAGARLCAIDAELSRRERLSRLNRGVASPSDQRYEQWRELARVVSERIDVVELMAICGHVLTPAGFNTRRNAREYAGSCPVCGGTDRLRCWGGPNGRAWCRQCHWSADAIAIAQSFLPGCEGFRDAVRTLAIMAGAVVPR